MIPYIVLVILVPLALTKGAVDFKIWIVEAFSGAGAAILWLETEGFFLMVKIVSLFSTD